MDDFPAWACVTEDECKALLAHGLEWCRKYADGTSESMMPQMFVLSKRSADDPAELHVFLLTDFNEDDEKRLMLRIAAMKLVSERRAPILVMMTAEAWNAPEERPGTPHLEPRHNPARREVLLAMLLDVGLQHPMMACLPICRDKNNMMVQDGEPSESRSVKPVLLRDFFRIFAEEGLASVKERREQTERN